MSKSPLIDTEETENLIKFLTFPDESKYYGQVAVQNDQYVPHGYGLMVTPDKFQMCGSFYWNKIRGFGRFIAPTGDKVYGFWDDESRRHGLSVFLRKGEDKVVLETYERGALIKRVRMANRLSDMLYWLPTPPVEYGFTCTKSGQYMAPHARHAHTVTLIPGAQPRLILYGGATRRDRVLSQFDDVWSFDVSTVTWTRLATKNNPAARHAHTATIVGSKLWVIGGFVGPAPTTDILCLDLDTLAWERPVSNIRDRVGFVDHSADKVGDRIVVIYGNGMGVVDTKALTWDAVRPKMLNGRPFKPLTNHATAAIGNRLFIHGGFEVSYELSDVKLRATADMRVMDLDSLEMWTVQPSMPKYTLNYQDARGKSCVDGRNNDDYGVVHTTADTPRCSHTATAMQNRYIVLIGGHLPSKPTVTKVQDAYLADVHVFDAVEERWVTPWIKYPVFMPRADHSAAQIGECIWVMGGKNNVYLESGMWDMAVLKMGPDPREMSKDVPEDD